jgi:hypothetical protein
VQGQFFDFVGKIAAFAQKRESLNQVGLQQAEISVGRSSQARS